MNKIMMIIVTLMLIATPQGYSKPTNIPSYKFTIITTNGSDVTLSAVFDGTDKKRYYVYTTTDLVKGVWVWDNKTIMSWKTPIITLPATNNVCFYKLIRSNFDDQGEDEQ